MIQLLSVVVFLVYFLGNPVNHARFRCRFLWFTGAVLSLISFSAAAHSEAGSLSILFLSVLPLILAIDYDSVRRS